MSFVVFPVPAAPGYPTCIQPCTCRPWLCIVGQDWSDYLHKEDLFFLQLSADNSPSLHFLHRACPASLQFQPRKLGQVCLFCTQKEEGFGWPSLSRFCGPMEVMAANNYGWVMEYWEILFAETHNCLAFLPRWYKRKITCVCKLQGISSVKTI